MTYIETLSNPGALLDENDVTIFCISEHVIGYKRNWSDSGISASAGGSSVGRLCSATSSAASNPIDVKKRLVPPPIPQHFLRN